MRKLILGLGMALSAVAMYVPAVAQSSDEATAEDASTQTQQSQTSESQVDQSSSVQQNNDANQTVRSSGEVAASPSGAAVSGSAQSPAAGANAQASGATAINQSAVPEPQNGAPVLNPPSSPQGVNGAQSTQAQAGPNQQPLPGQAGSQQSVLQRPGQASNLAQPNQQQLGSQQLNQPLNQQQLNQQSFNSQQFSSQELNQQQFDQQLGIQFQQSNQVGARGLAIGSIQPNSVFFNSGLRQGDLLLSLNNRPIVNQAEFVRLFTEHPGQRIPLIVMRGGRQETIFINRPAQFDVTVQQQQPVQLSQAILGVTFDPQIANAAIVRSVSPGSPAELAGLQSGDQITALNGRQISSSHEATQMIGSMAPGQEVLIDYSRQQMDVRTQAVLAPRNGGPVEHSVGYAPEPATRVITPAPLPVDRQVYRPLNRRGEYYYEGYRPVRPRAWRYRYR